MQELVGHEGRVLLLTSNPACWPSLADNMMTVERYAFFQACFAGMPSLLEAGRDECPQSGMLAVVLDPLMALIQQFGGSWAPPPDIRAVLDAERRRVLFGVCLTFSRVIPGEQPAAAHPLWRMAERFGASCREGVSEGVTHVVAVTEGTDKVRGAWLVVYVVQCVLCRWSGRITIAERWCCLPGAWVCGITCVGIPMFDRVECSCTLWQRANEERFALRSLGTRMAA